MNIINGPRMWRCRVGVYHSNVSFEAIDADVAKRYKITPERLKRHGRAAGDAKAVAIRVPCLLTGQNQRVVGYLAGSVRRRQAQFGGLGAVRARFRNGQESGADVLRKAFKEIMPELQTWYL